MSPSWIYICLVPRKKRDKKGIHEQSRTHDEEDDKGQKPPRTKDAMSPTGCLHVFCQGKTMRHGYVRLTTKRTIAEEIHKGQRPARTQRTTQDKGWQGAMSPTGSRSVLCQGNRRESCLASKIEQARVCISKTCS